MRLERTHAHDNYLEPGQLNGEDVEGNRDRTFQYPDLPGGIAWFGHVGRESRARDGLL